MKEEPPFESGAANMPPFPRTDSHSRNEPAPEPPAARAESERGAAPDANSAAFASTSEPTTSDAAPSEDVDAGGTFSSGPAAPLGDSDPDPDPESDDPLEEDDLLDTTADARRDFAAESIDDDPDFDDGERSFRSIAGAELARRAEIAVLKGMERVADSLDETAHRIHRLANLRGGPDAAEFGPVHSTVGSLEGAADYLRSSDLEAVRTDLRRRVRARPVQTLGIALCAGWVVGRILR